MSVEEKIYQCYIKAAKERIDKLKVTEVWNAGDGFDNLKFINLRLALAQNYGIDIELIQGNKNSKNAILFQGYRYTYFRIIETSFHKSMKDKIFNMQINENALLTRLRSINNKPKSGVKPLSDESTIKYLYDLYIEGLSLQDIANKLNIEKIKTSRGGKWYKSTVKYILTNEEYLKSGIISNEQFEKVKFQLKKRKKKKVPC